jgi:hypothetical protein
LQINVAFRTHNTVRNTPKPHTQTDKYNRSGIYQRKCPDFPLKYIGQTGRTLNIRYKEHIQALRNNNNNSDHSNHTLKTGHSYGTITDTKDIIKTERKGKHLNTLQKYYIYRIRITNIYICICISTHTTPYLWYYMNFTPDGSTPPVSL